jgi:uncharacterized protein (DUF1501 family)
MKRRTFLRRAVPFSTLPFLMNGFSVTAFGRSPLVERLTGLAAESDRVLLLVQLSGGNDGLNTVIPRDQYTALAAARNNILIPEGSVLPLTDATGLHPSMTALQQLYQSGLVAVVQSVGYANPNLSHFRATDIWLTASDSNQTLTSGWLGRYLDSEYPGFPASYPTAEMPDPLAIQIGSVVSPGLMGPSVSMGMAITNPSASYILPGGSDTPPTTPAGHELTFIRMVAQQTAVYADGIKQASSRVTNLSTKYPAAGTNSVADQMKIVARLIAGGLKTRVYVVSQGGYDTHSNQAVGGYTATGNHANLLRALSDAIAAFQDDITLLGVHRRVVGLTFSEFGRRIKSNASNGTDHGTAAPVFLFGHDVQGGVVGSNPQLPASATVSDNIPMQYDFRMLYATVLRDWFGMRPSDLALVLPDHTATLPLIQPSAVVGVVDPADIPSEFSLAQNFPNPFNPATTIRYELARGSSVVLEVYDMAGRLVRTLVRGEQPAGVYTLTFEGQGLASGTYLYRLQAGNFVETRRMVLLR